MADVADILKRSVVRVAEREIDRNGALKAAVLAGQELLAANALGSPGVILPDAELFATGYDAGTGETTGSFMFDRSAFDGPDILL